MNKLWLIFQREYLTRVRKLSFIIGTLLAPLGLVVYFLVIVGLSKYSGGDEIRVAVVDEAKMLKNLPDEKDIRFLPAGEKTFEQWLDEAKSKRVDAVLKVPAIADLKAKNHTIYFYSEKKLAPEKSKKIERLVARRIEDFKIESQGLDKKILEGLDTDISIDPEPLDGSKGDNESKLSTGVGIGLGFIMAFIMFFMITMYGNMIMRSVMEEKTNRIVEVMMSSVRPFQLMLGKILGAGAVGMTQVVAWGVLSAAVMFLMPMLVDFDPKAMNDAAGASAQVTQSIDPEEAQSMISKIWTEVTRQNWWLILGTFVLYFLGGFFMYSSLFAAIGSAMSDDMGEGQALTLPVMIPLILSIYIVSMAGIRNPDSDLMVFASLFPLFSPVAMPFRLAFDPPWWHIVLSLVLLVATVFFFVWLAGRIYRVGILLYGKKVTFKEIGRWMFYR